jgi:hypothetical protein
VSIRYHLAEELPPRCWIRFTEPVAHIDAEIVAAGWMFLVVAMCQKTCEVALATPGLNHDLVLWDLKGLLMGKAEWSEDRRCWNRVGYSIRFGQLKPDGTTEATP